MGPTLPHHTTLLHPVWLALIIHYPPPSPPCLPPDPICVVRRAIYASAAASMIGGNSSAGAVSAGMASAMAALLANPQKVKRADVAAAYLASLYRDDLQIDKVGQEDLCGSN